MFSGKIKNGILAYRPRVHYKDLMHCTWGQDRIQWLSGSIFIEVRLSCSQHAPVPLANLQTSCLSASLLPQTHPPTIILIPGNLSLGLHLSLSVFTMLGRKVTHPQITFFPSFNICYLKLKSWIGLPIFSPTFPSHGGCKFSWDFLWRKNEDLNIRSQ